MQTSFWSVGAAVVLLLSGFSEAAQAQSHPVSHVLPALGQPISIIGAVKQVNLKIDRVIFAGNDGRSYLLDMTHAKITAPVGSPLVLKERMQAYVFGVTGVGGSIVVSRFQILPSPGVMLPAVLPSVTDTGNTPDLTVRGTVEAVDFERGSFVLRISTHTRIVFVTADTDLLGLGPLADSQFPVQPGQRVTVGGSLQPNGTILAGLLTLKEHVNYETAVNQANRVLIGVVSSPPKNLRGRDFKIRAEDGAETKMRVPRGIPIRRKGRPISVYDLSRRDTVRITGRLNGPDFQAARIDVLAPVPDHALDTEPHTRPAKPVFSQVLPAYKANHAQDDNDDMQ